MNIRRFFLWSVGTLLVLVLAVAAGVYWASRSETFLRWGIDRFASSLPCSLKVEGLKGAFMEPVQVQHLVCENSEYRIEAHDVAMIWSPLLLTGRRLDITSLQMQSLAYTSKPQTAPAGGPLTDVGLPIRVDIASLKIASLKITAPEIQAGEQPLQLTGIDATYRGDARMHRLRLRNVESEWGRATADATMGAAAPFALTAALTVDTNHFEGWPVSASVALKGDLLGQISATFNATTRDIAVDGALALAPFDVQPVKSVSVHAANIDAATIGPAMFGAEMFDARWPHTALAINVEAKPLDNSSLTGHVRAENSAAGRLDEQKLPVRHLNANFTANMSAQNQLSLQLSDLKLDLGKAGSASGSADLSRDHATLSLNVHDLDLQAARADLRQTRLNGVISIEQRDERQFVALDLKEQNMQLEARGEVSPQRIIVERMTARAGGAQLHGSATMQLDDEFGFSVDGTLTRFDPARFGDFPEADLNATLQVRGRLRPDWRAQVTYRLAPSRLNAVALGGEGKFAVTPTRLHAADALLDYGGNRVKLTGSFGASGDVLHFSVDAKHLERLAREATGSVVATGELTGTLKRPSISADLEGRALSWSGLSVNQIKAQFSANQLSAEQAKDLSLHGQARLQGIKHGETSVDTLTAAVDGTLAKHKIDVALTAPDLQLAAQLDGGWDTSRRVWLGDLNRFTNEGEYAFDMKRPARLELAEDHFVLGATQVIFSKTEINLEETRYDNGKLAAKGSVNGVRLARLMQLMEKPPAVESTLVLGGRWEIRADKTVDGFIELSRTEGDLVVLGEEPLALGLKEFRVVARAAGNKLTAEAVMQSAHGDAQFSAQTRLENRGGKWGIAGSAPLELAGDLHMQSIRPLATLASRTVTADGKLKLAVKANGSIAEPRLSGSIEGDNLKVEDVANGIFLHDGVVRASFGENALTLTQLRFKAGEGEVTAKGRFIATGKTPVMELQWNAQKLAAIQHPELRLTVSGAGELAYRDKIMSLKGELRADRGRVILRNRTFPALGDDVVVVGREKPSQIATETKRAVLDLKLDLGPDFTIVGRGLDARMEGKVHLTSAPDKPLSADGEVKVASGTFDAYGRRLQIDKGTVYFAGPVNNPSLNIRAMRKNQQVEAGVEITGTAHDPRVRLVSEPNVPDPQKLAWLVLGREAESGSSQDSRALQGSAMALAAGLGTTPLQQQLARAVGLDEINLIPGSNGSEGVVAVGKQLSNKIYVTQEFSASAASNTLRISYQLTRHWSLRSESGETDAVDLFFTFSFD